MENTLQISTLEDAQNILLSAEYNEAQLVQLGQILRNSKMDYIAIAAFNKALYLSPNNDQTLSQYLSFLVSAKAYRPALDLLLHAYSDMHKSADREQWICQLLRDFSANQVWLPTDLETITFNQIEIVQCLDLATFCARQSLDYKILTAPKQINITGTHCSNPIYHKLVSGIYKQPELGYAIVPNTRFSEHSHALLSGDFCVQDGHGVEHRDELNLHGLKESTILYVPGVRSSTYAGIVRKRPPKLQLNGLYLSGLTPQHAQFSHFLFNTLAQCVLLKTLPDGQDATILLSEHTPKSWLALFDVFDITNPLHFVPADTVVEVEQAIVFSGIANLANELASQRYPLASSIFVSDRAIAGLIQSLPAPNNKMPATKRKIVLTNAFTWPSSLETSLIEMGFEFFELNTLSMLEQIELVQSAEVIVGKLEQGLDKVLFCRAGTQLFALSDFNEPVDPLIYLAKLSNQINVTFHHFFTHESEPLLAALTERYANNG